MRRLALLAAAVGLALPPVVSASPLTAGFYLPWDAGSQAALAAHAQALDVVSPMSASVDTPQGHVRWQPDPALAALRAKGTRRPKVMPIVSNAHDTIWDAASAEAVLSDPDAGQAVIAELTAKAASEHYAGYVLDFETLTPKAQAGYPAFLARLRTALKPAGREVWATAFFSADGPTLKALGQSTDAVVLMAYDQCWATSTPGPVAGLDWLARNLDAKLPNLDPAHTLVALGAYGYDWPQGSAAKVVSAPQAQALAAANHAAIARNPDEANPHFAYATPDGREHQVWWLDAAAFDDQRVAVLARKVRGVAVWRLGLEDPALWSHPGSSPALTATPPAPFCTLLPPTH